MTYSQFIFQGIMWVCMCSYHQTMVEVIKEQNENMFHIFIYDSIILHRLENRTRLYQLLMMVDVGGT